MYICKTVPQDHKISFEQLDKYNLPIRQKETKKTA